MTDLTDPKKQLGTAIRGWIHMDNLTESFTTQAANARKLRNKHEDDAIRLIKQIGIQDSVINVSGASLRLTTKKSPAGLTWSYLETEIAAWATHNKLTATQSAGLVSWLQSHRETKEVEFLKKEMPKT